MSILNKIKRLFGFGDDDPEMYDEIGLLPEGDEEEEVADVALTIECPKVQPEMVQEIFTSVVGVFTEALPGFISNSVDPEKMSMQLYESLEESTKKYLEDLESQVRHYYEIQWSAERKKLEDNASALKEKTQELQNKQNALSDSKLSAERQKRALSDRVRDLEQEVQKLEAEKEQLSIENKCMINKTKVVAVLEEELEALRGSKSDNPSAAVEATGDNQELLSQIEALQEELKKSGEELEEIKAQLGEKEALLSEKEANIEDINQQLISKAALLEEKSAQLEESKASLSEKISELEESKASLTEKIIELEEKDLIIEEKEAALIEQEETQKEIEEIKRHVEKFEEVREKMNDRYEKLRDAMRGVQTENESLRQTIRNNLMENAEVQKKLRERISELEDEVETEESKDTLEVAASKEEVYQPKQTPVTKRRKQHADASDIDDIMSGADWLVATPATDTSMRSEQSNSDFGYQPPQRKPKPLSNSSQPSLFDL